MNADHTETSNAIRDNGKRRVWILIAVWIVLIIQGGVDGIARYTDHDAFPTIAMPAFSAKNIGNDNKARVTRRHIEVIDSHGEAHTVKPEQLLQPMPVASAVATLDRLFQPSKEKDPGLSEEAIRYLEQQARRLDLNSEPTGLRLTWQRESFDTRTLERTPTGAPTIREVSW